MYILLYIQGSSTICLGNSERGPEISPAAANSLSVIISISASRAVYYLVLAKASESVLNCYLHLQIICLPENDLPKTKKSSSTVSGEKIIKIIGSSLVLEVPVEAVKQDKMFALC